MKQKRRSLLHILRHPVDPETRNELRARWAALPASLRTGQQLLGRTELGCGATVGVMPRCDFACQACYLGNGANRVPPLPLDAVKQQMRVLRRYLGPSGNLQLTDGEVTLRPVEDLIELLRTAHQLELIPMLMTHGDTFRRHPDLLRRLVIEGGLRELSIHIDVTQRGRKGSDYKNADCEDELMPLRDEFARLIRAVRKETRRPLRVASTVTVTRDNLDNIPAVVRWFARNSDVFRLLSLQPIAQVGRTIDGLGDGVDVDALWDKIGAGLSPGNQASKLHDNCWCVGHPACNRILTGFVVCPNQSDSVLHCLTRTTGPFDERVLTEFIDRFGGVRFRGDSWLEAAVRVLGMTLAAPRLMAWTLPRYALHWLRRMAREDGFRFVCQLLSDRARVNRFTVVSHHFMSSDEIQTSLGQDRLEQCVFRVPVNGALMSMCEFNANGHRDEHYRLTSPHQDHAQLAEPIPRGC